MNIYGIIILGLMALSLMINMSKHGEEKKLDHYDFYKSFFFLTIQLWLFYMAGLFN